MLLLDEFSFGVKNQDNFGVKKRSAPIPHKILGPRYQIASPKVLIIGELWSTILTSAKAANGGNTTKGSIWGGAARCISRTTGGSE